MTGERGPQGDHGQIGDTGPRGPEGPRYSSLLTRHVVAAYSVVLLGVLLGFVFSQVRFDQAMDQIDQRARQLCEAGNIRSQIAKEDFETTAAQLRQPGWLEDTLGLTPERADELRRITEENSSRRVKALPFLDCQSAGSLVPTTSSTVP